MSTAKQPLAPHAQSMRGALPPPEPTWPRGASPEIRPAEVTPSALPEGLIDLGLLWSADGSPVRLRRNGRQKKAVQLYYSVKMGAHVPCESLLELHDMWRAEVQPAIMSYYAQPFTLMFMLDGEKRSYTPDRQDLYSNGAVVVTEIKDEVAGSPDPREAQTLEAASLLFAARDLKFEVRRRAEIHAQPFFNAYELIQHHRRTKVKDEEVYRVRRALQHEPWPLSIVQDNLGGGPLGLAKTYALMVRRVLTIDLSAGLHPDALVTAVQSR